MPCAWYHVAERAVWPSIIALDIVPFKQGVTGSNPVRLTTEGGLKPPCSFVVGDCWGERRPSLEWPTSSHVQLLDGQGLSLEFAAPIPHGRGILTRLVLKKRGNLPIVIVGEN